MKVYFVTGEPSGDLLASSLMKSLKDRSPDVKFFGVGGETMKAQGLESLFSMSELSVMGFFEVLPRLPLILKRIKQTVADIERVEPDIIITVDSWGFVGELLGRLKKKNIQIPKLHYVAPQVWAWKKGRAKKVAKLTDCLLTLLPYEPQYFEKYGLKCHFVGHPVVENNMDDVDAGDFRKRHNIPEDADIYTVLPGSRIGEVKRLVPVFKKALDLIARKKGDFFIVVPTVETVVDEIKKAFADTNCRIVTGRNDRYAAFKASRAAIAASGTVSLELVACETPHIIAYKFNPVTDFFADIVVKIKYVNLINILCDKEIIPEFTLDECRADLIAAKIIELTDKSIARAMMNEAAEGFQKLSPSGMRPSEQAAEIVVQMIAARSNG